MTNIKENLTKKIMEKEITSEENGGGDNFSKQLKCSKEELVDNLGINNIPKEIKEYRKSWKEKISKISNENKNKIIKIADTIPTKVNIDDDGSKLIELKLGDKTRKILDPNIESHTDDKYKLYLDFNLVGKNKYAVHIGGMSGGDKRCRTKLDNINKWKNKNLIKYIKENQKKGLRVASIEEIKKLLSELGDRLGSKDEKDQIAMLMYLTGMDGWYWLIRGDYPRSTGDTLLCDARYRFFDRSEDLYSLNICMIACE